MEVSCYTRVTGSRPLKKVGGKASFTRASGTETVCWKQTLWSTEMFWDTCSTCTNSFWNVITKLVILLPKCDDLNWILSVLSELWSDLDTNFLNIWLHFRKNTSTFTRSVLKCGAALWKVLVHVWVHIYIVNRFLTLFYKTCLFFHLFLDFVSQCELVTPGVISNQS